MKKLSFIVPVYNEQANLAPLFDELAEVAGALALPWEILFIDDGSSDGSLAVIQELAANHPQVGALALLRNSGQSAALYYGFQQATGDVIITLDADLQNDPADIPAMLAYYGDYQVVNGWRHNRRDTWSKRIGSRIGNGFRNWMTGENIRDTGCSLKVMDAVMVKRIRMFRGLHRFLPTLMRLEGARVIEVKVNHRPRRAGVSKYTNLRRGLVGFHDVMAVRWMIKRHIKIEARKL
jgi:dolichol-phosphate mannosyltransferase